jgi:hypothetical protein
VKDLDSDREKALNAVLNNPEVAGDWDYTKLPAFLESIAAEVQPMTGWDPSEIAAMIGKNLTDIDLGSGFSATNSAESNEFSMTFVFSKADQEPLDKYIKDFGKDAIVAFIVQKVRENYHGPHTH